MARKERYAMSRGKYGWSIHQRRTDDPDLSLCGHLLRRQDFSISSMTKVCANCRKKAAHA